METNFKKWLKLREIRASDDWQHWQQSNWEPKGTGESCNGCGRELLEDEHFICSDCADEHAKQEIERWKTSQHRRRFN